MDMVWQNVKSFCEKVSKHHISEYTAQCAYYTVLSFIPFLLLIVTLVQYTPISRDTLFSIVQNLLPESMGETALGIIQEVYSKSLGTVSTSAVFVLWSARRGFYALSKGLHDIYETDKESNFIIIQIKSLILTAFLVLVIISVLVLSVFGNSIVDLLKTQYNISNSVLSIVHFSKIAIYAVLFVVLLLIYKFIPGHKQKFIMQIPGAVIATWGWFVISAIFSIYLDAFKGFSVMYGSLTTIVLAMMWVYFCVYSILIGAVINNYIVIKISK